MNFGEGRCADCGGGKDYWKHHAIAKVKALDEYHEFRSEKDIIVIGKESSIGDPDWGMYVTPDDPSRDTPEKARNYYERLFKTYPALAPLPPTQAQRASTADIEAAKALLGA